MEAPHRLEATLIKWYEFIKTMLNKLIYFFTNGENTKISRIQEFLINERRSFFFE